MYPIADMLIRIKNAYLVKEDRVSVPFSKIKLSIAQILKEHGYLTEVERRKHKSKKSEHEYLDLSLRYGDNGPAFNDVRIVSRPSRHLYAKAREMKPVHSGYGIAVVSTPKGIMTSREARKQNVGGEILFEIW